MNPKFFSPEYLQYAIPTAVGLSVGLVILLLSRSKRRTSELARPATANGSTRSSQWVTQTASLSERRNSVRRDGAPVKVILASPTFKTGTASAYVVDRSTGGLRLATSAAIAPGTTMQIRAHHAPENTPWVVTIVRSCKNTGEHFELGCEFDKTPPWNVLLLFG